MLPDARHPEGEVRVRQRHRLLEPLPVLHEHVRVAQHPRPRAGVRDRPQVGQPRARRSGSSPATATALSIGGNHLIHVLRRNVDLKILLFNNRIYGLTKGQYSPTSPLGKKTKSTPLGSIDYPLNPICVALGADATFVARTLDVRRAAPCRRCSSAPPPTRARRSSRSTRTATSSTTAPSRQLTEKDTKADRTLELEHGKPLLFGKNKEKGIVLDGRAPRGARGRRRCAGVGEQPAGSQRGQAARPRRDERAVLAAREPARSSGFSDADRRVSRRGAVEL